MTTRRVIATIGLHGSASTWVFNVIRELTIAAFGERQVLTFYADELGQVSAETLTDGRHLIVKSHHGSTSLDSWLEASRSEVFVSIRDPRDASVSMSQRFNAPLSIAAGWLANDCKRIMRLETAYTLLRYEDRFFEDKTMVEQLAFALGLELEPIVIQSIFSRYRTEQVRSFARTLTDLPDERL